jgi:ABC-type transport system involved in multi-copper enzyme maturation permease subunit
MIRAFRSEWLKIGRRSMLIGSLGALVGFTMLGVFLSVFRADNGRGALTIARLSQPDGFAQILQRGEEFLGVIALGIVAIATAQEYTHGTLRSLLTREPRRLRLLAGKTAANLLYVGAAVLVASVIALVTALIVAPHRGIDTSGWLGSGLGDTLSTMGNVVFAAVGWGVFGALLALVLRAPAPAVIAGVAWALPVENLLTSAWTSVGHWLPGQQLLAVAQRGNNVSSYGWGLGLSVVFVIAAAVAGGALFRTRDVAV